MPIELTKSDSAVNTKPLYLISTSIAFVEGSTSPGGEASEAVLFYDILVVTYIGHAPSSFSQVQLLFHASCVAEILGLPSDFGQKSSLLKRCSIFTVRMFAFRTIQRRSPRN